MEAARPLSPAESVQAELDRVQFAWGRYQLQARYLDSLAAAARILTEHPELEVEILGHTDSTGPELYNMWLSKRRAETVRDVLVQYGVEPERLVIHGRGPFAPVDSNGTAEGRAKNRRSEIKVRSTSEAQAAR